MAGALTQAIAAPVEAEQRCQDDRGRHLPAVPGGLAQVNIFGSLVFAGMSGSALADIGGIGRIEIDAMRSKGFKPAFASAVTCSSAIVGPIFPPSIPLIIYGTVTGASVIQLLLGGILPGLRRLGDVEHPGQHQRPEQQQAQHHQRRRDDEAPTPGSHGAPDQAPPQVEMSHSQHGGQDDDEHAVLHGSATDCPA